MSNGPLIVPVALTNGSLQFASIQPDGTVQDVLNALTGLGEVKADTLGGLEESGWALQKVLREQTGRRWEEDELEAVGDGIVEPHALVSPLLHDTKPTHGTERHFSAFPLTSHIHVPTLRLVSLHPLLSVRLFFFRVPEVHDGFQRRYYISRTTPVEAVISSVVEELGLTKSLPILGGGNIEYVLEEVWRDGKQEKSSRLPYSHFLSETIDTPFMQNPFTPTASRSLCFCVPDEWYRRSKTHKVSLTVSEPSESTLKQFQDMGSENGQTDEDEDEGTAKQDKRSPSELPSRNSISSEWQGSVSQNRLSSIFGSWLKPSAPTSPASTVSTAERKSVSEPRLLEQHTGSSLQTLDDNNAKGGDSEVADGIEFEQMLDELDLKGPRRNEMYQLSPDRKRYLMQQNREFRSSSNIKATAKSDSPRRNHPSYFASYGPSNAGNVLPRLMPQLTGDSGLMRRLSITNWASTHAPPTMTSDVTAVAGEFGRSSMVFEGGHKAPTESTTEDIPPLQPQSTGGLWSSWWASSGGEKPPASSERSKSKTTEKSARWYVDGLRSWKTTDTKLVKHLISLRVHLSTAKLLWIEEFLGVENGLDVLGSLLAGLVGKGGKKRQLNDIESKALLEILRCIRVLLNTQFGFNKIASSPQMVTHIAYSLHSSPAKLCALSSEMLAAICMLSIPEGHKAVLAAMSDYRIAFEESFRFDSLIASLRLPDMTVEDNISGDDSFDSEDEGVWGARAASMTLVNSLANCPETLEERVMLREEFGRRGLNEAIVTLRYTKPPDSLLTQLDVYTEEKFEDEEEMRERTQALMTKDALGHRSEFQIALDDVIQLAKQYDGLYPTLVEILKHYGSILHRDTDTQLKTNLFTILDTFVLETARLDGFDNWDIFLQNIAKTIQQVTGRVLEVDVTSGSGSTDVIEQELESLHSQVEELSNERSRLRSELNEHIAEINTLKSLPISTPSKASGKGGPESFHGIVQRLIQKEKQVLQLQAELDRSAAQVLNEDQEAMERAKRDRDRVKWNTLMDEITKLKIKNGELEEALTSKDKDIIYLKRAMESVYSRFQSKEDSREREPNIDAQQMASRAIEKLIQGDEEITSLRSEIADLKSQLAVKPQFVTEKDFKAQFPPPPPPVSRPKLNHTKIPQEDHSPIPTSPPPPPPLPPTVQSPPPPPPPPPPPSTGTDTASLVGAKALFPPSPPPPPTNLSNPDSPPSPPPPPPPPFLGAVLPPPPPPPSAFNMSKKPRPTKRLKPFFWNKVSSPNVASTVWSEVSSNFNFNMDDLETTFALESASTTSSQILVNPSRKQMVTTLLDISRANNIAIMLSRIKLGFPEIRKALLDPNDQRLSFDDLKAISKQLPTAEEIGRIKDFVDVGKLAKADQYFSEIMTIPRLAGRLDCMLFRRKLELDIEEIRPELDILRNASRELRSSNRFKQVLQTILALGNALNGSTYRGNARGFQLEALIKLKETKTAKASPDCPTLLHYLARVLLRSDVTLVNFIDEFPHLEAAARVSVQTLTQSVHGLATGLSQVSEEMQQLKKLRTLPLDDLFITVMQPFASQAAPGVEALKNMSASVDNELRSLLAYYGEAPDSPEAPKPEEFFGLILSFSTSLQKCALEVHGAEFKLQPPPKPAFHQSAEAAPEITIKVELASSVPSAPTPPDYAQDKRTIGRGDFDQAIQSMRDGKRRARPARPLSKIFLDGGRPQSRVFD